MTYAIEVKEKVRNLYQRGMPRREISELEGIPLPTIRSWTVDEVSAPLSFITCVVCGKKKRTHNIQQRYCSRNCRNRASYIHRKEKTPQQPIELRTCEHCGKRYQPVHGNAVKYCTAVCRKRAAKQRLHQQRAQVRQVLEEQRLQQEQQRLEQELSEEQFYSCLEQLWEVRKHPLNDLKIDGNRYSQEIAIITAYNADHRHELSEGDDFRVQQIFKSIIRR